MDDLAQLTAEAAAIDAQLAPATPTPEQPAAPQVSPNDIAEMSALLQIVAGMFSPLFPSLANVYTPQSCDALASAAIPVMAKHGWSVSGLLGNYAEEVALLAVAAPMALATYGGIKADIASAKSKAKAKDEEASEQIAKTAVEAVIRQDGAQA